MIRRSDCTIHKWKNGFLEAGEIPVSWEGHYQQSGVLWFSEELNKRPPSTFMTMQMLKGKPILVFVVGLIMIFCPIILWNWVFQEESLWKQLGSGYIIWVLRFLYLWHPMCMGGVMWLKKFIRIMSEIGFVHPSHALTPEAAWAFPSDIILLFTEQRDKLVFMH